LAVEPAPPLCPLRDGGRRSAARGARRDRHGIVLHLVRHDDVELAGGAEAGCQRGIDAGLRRSLLRFAHLAAADGLLEAIHERREIRQEGRRHVVLEEEGLVTLRITEKDAAVVSSF
jgi:hypothetical protein